MDDVPSVSSDDEQGPPKTTALQALYALTGRAAEGTHRQVTFRTRSDNSESSVAPAKETTDHSHRPKTPKVLRRPRPASAKFARPADKVMIPCNLVLQTLASSMTRTISDTAVAPKPFTDKRSQDPEAWLEYFERY